MFYRFFIRFENHIYENELKVYYYIRWNEALLL